MNDSMDWDKNINFDHIVESPEYKDKFKFAVINDERGKIQRAMHKGWMIWDKSDDGYVDKWSERNKSAAKLEEDDSQVARVPVGRGSDGPCEAFLMYMPIDMWNERVGDVHKRRADDQLHMVNDSARSAAEANSEGLETVRGYDVTPVELKKGPESDVAQGNS